MQPTEEKHSAATGKQNIQQYQETAAKRQKLVPAAPAEQEHSQALVRQQLAAHQHTHANIQGAPVVQSPVKEAPQKLSADQVCSRFKINVSTDVSRNFFLAREAR